MKEDLSRRFFSAICPAMHGWRQIHSSLTDNACVSPCFIASSHGCHRFHRMRVGVLIRIKRPAGIRFAWMRDVVRMMKLMSDFIGEECSQFGQTKVSVGLLQ